MITLIDLGALFWREAFGGNDPLRGYTESLTKLDRYRGSRAIVCADSPRSIRRETRETYKSNRKPKPQEAVEALSGVIERASAWLPIAQCEGWEADDVICTLVAQSWPEEVEIVGCEKDFFCLLDDERVWLLRDNGTRIASAQCLDKFGVAPSQMTEWLALVGDAADGVQGCPNCGPKRASQLLGAYGTIAGVKAAIASGALAQGTLPGVGEKTLASLAEWDPGIALDLIRMRCDLPLNLGALLP